MRFFAGGHGRAPLQNENAEHWNTYGFQEMFLDEILRHKVLEIEERKTSRPIEEIHKFLKGNEPSAGRPRFADVLKRNAGERLRLIAEIKKASPSRGVLCERFDVETIARTYERGGAKAISVLTDERFFQGRPEYVGCVARTVSLPVLAKDFFLDPYQIYEAKSFGASAVLLIAAALGRKKLLLLLEESRNAGVDALVEIHDPDELQVALACGANLLGINNRDLRTFQVDLENCERLSRMIPSGVTTVVESGILNRADVERVGRLPVDAILVGEALMLAPDIEAKIKEFTGL